MVAFEKFCDVTHAHSLHCHCTKVDLWNIGVVAYPFTHKTVAPTYKLHRPNIYSARHWCVEPNEKIDRRKKKTRIQQTPGLHGQAACEGREEIKNYSEYSWSNNLITPRTIEIDLNMLIASFIIAISIQFHCTHGGMVFAEDCDAFFFFFWYSFRFRSNRRIPLIFCLLGVMCGADDHSNVFLVGARKTPRTMVIREETHSEAR